MNLSPVEAKICLALMNEPLSVYEIVKGLNERVGGLPNHISCKNIKKGLCTDSRADCYEKIPTENKCKSCGRHVAKLYSESYVYNHIGGSNSSSKLIDGGVLKQKRNKKFELCDGCHNGILINQENKLIYICPNQDFCIHKDANNGCIYSHLTPLLQI